MNLKQSKAEDSNGLGHQISSSGIDLSRRILKLRMRDSSEREENKSRDDPEPSKDNSTDDYYDDWLKETLLPQSKRMKSAKHFLKAVKEEDQRTNNGEKVNFQGKCTLGKDHAVFYGTGHGITPTEGYSMVWCDGETFRFTGSKYCHNGMTREMDCLTKTCFNGPLRFDEQGHLCGDFKIGTTYYNMSGMFKHKLSWNPFQGVYSLIFERPLFVGHGQNGKRKDLLNSMMNAAESFECECCGTTNLMKSSVNRCCMKGFVADYRSGGIEDEVKLRSFAVMGLDALELHLDVLRGMDSRQERVRGITKVRNSFPFRMVENLKEVLPSSVKNRICDIEVMVYDKFTAHAPTSTQNPEGFFTKMFNMVKDSASYYSTRLTEMAPQIVNRMFDFVKVTFSFVSEGLVQVFERVKEALTRLFAYIMSPFEIARDVAKGCFDRVIKTCLLILLFFLCSIGLFSFGFGYLLGRQFAGKVETTFVAHAPMDVTGAAIGITAFCVGGCSRGMNKELGQKARTLVALVAGGAILSQFVKALIYLLPSTIQLACIRKWGTREKNAELDANEWIPRATALCKVSLIPEMLVSKYYFDQLNLAVNDIDKFLKDLPMSKRGEVLSLYSTLMKKLMICQRVQGAEVKRRIPFSFHIAGAPGVGKSLMLTHLLHDVFEKKLGDVYQRSVSSEYWDRYALEPIVVYDEFLIGNSGTEFNQTISREYLNLVSPTRFQPPMASVDDPIVGVKGTEARPLVVVTLNNTTHNAPTNVDRKAFQRRRRFVVQMKLRVGARMVNGSSNVDLAQYSAEEIASVSWAAFRILPGEHSNVHGSGGAWYDYEELVNFIKHDYESHSEICDLLENSSDARSDLPSPEEMLQSALKNTNFIPTEDVGVCDAVLMWMSSIFMTNACANGSRGRRRKQKREDQRKAREETKPKSVHSSDSQSVTSEESYQTSDETEELKTDEDFKKRFDSLRGYKNPADLPPPKSRHDGDDNQFPGYHTPPPIAKDQIFDYDHTCLTGASNIVVVDGMVHRHPCINKKYGCQRNVVCKTLDNCRRRCTDCVNGHVENNIDFLTYEYNGVYAPDGEIVWGRKENETRGEFLKRLRDHYSVPVNMTVARCDAIFCDMLYCLEMPTDTSFSEFVGCLIKGTAASFVQGIVAGLTVSLGLLFISWSIRWFMGHKNESLADDFTACGATGASLKTSKRPHNKKGGRRMNFARGKTHKGFTAHAKDVPMVEVENVTTGHKVRCLPVKGHWIITYSHLWLCLFSDGDKLKIRYEDTVVEETYVEDNMIADEDEDVLLYKIETRKHQQFPDYTRKYMTRTEMEEFKNCSVHVKTKGYTQYAHCMKSVDIAYSHQGYRFNPQNVVHISAASMKGDCGNAVIATNGLVAGKVLGVIVAGATDGAPQSIAVLFNVEDIMHAIEPGPEVHTGISGEIYKPTPDMEFEAHSVDCFAGEKNSSFPNLISVGILEMKEIVHQPIKSKLKPSVLAEHLPWKSTKQPAVLHREDSRTKNDPVETALKNCFNVEQVDLDEDLVKEVFKDLKSNYVRDLTWPIGKRSLTFEEACGGIPGKLASLNVNTSCGWPKITYRKRKGKKDFFWFNEEGELEYDEGFKQEVLDFVEVWKRGEGIYHRWVGYFKDELVSMSKIEEARTRVIYCGDVTGVVALRMLYGSLLCAVSESVNKIPMAIGMNQYSWDMEKVHRYLTRLGGKKFVAGDYKAFDQHYQKAFQVAAFDLVHELVFENEEKGLLKVMKEHQIESWAQLDRYEFKAKCYHYSGCLFTAIVNCFVNEAYFRYLFKIHFKGHCFDECCAIKTLGDDHVLCMNENVMWTGPQIQKHMKEVGQVYTNVDKENPVIPDSVSFEETTFLGAHPVRVLGVYSGALRKDTLFMCPMWTRNDNHTLIEEVKAMVEFASQWPEDFYLWYTSELKSAAEKAGVCIPMVNPWGDERRRVASRTAASELDFKQFVGMGKAEDGLTKLVTSEEEAVTAQGLKETDLLHLSSQASMSLQYGTKSLIRRGAISWTTSHDKGQTLVDVAMPHGALILGSPDNLQNMPFYSFLYWRGCIEIKLQINGTPFQAGALIAFVNPLVPDDVTHISHCTAMQHVIIQPNGNTTASLTIPFNFPTKRLNTTHDAWPAGEMFRFVVKVLSPLKVGTNGSESATVTMFTRFPDSEFALPKALTASETTKQQILRGLCARGETLPLLKPRERLEELVQEHNRRNPRVNKFKKRAEIKLKGDDGVCSKWQAHGQYTSTMNYYSDIAGSVSAEVRQTPTQDISPGLSASYGGDASTGTGHGSRGTAGSSVDSKPSGGGMPWMNSKPGVSGGLSFNNGKLSGGLSATIGTQSGTGISDKVNSLAPELVRSKNEGMTPAMAKWRALNKIGGKSMPMDNPIIGGNSVSVAPKYPSLCKSEGLEPTNVLALKPNELQRHHEAQIGEPGEDLIESLCARPTKIADLTWDGNDAADSALWTFPLNSLLADHQILGYDMIPFALGILNLFVYFHCDFVFDIMVFRTGFHSGRLKFVVGYGSDELPILDDQGYFQEILDFNEDHYTQRVIVPWNYLLEYAKTYKGSGADFFLQSLGYGSLKVLNVLKFPDSVADSVDVQVFISLQNVRVAVPHPSPLVSFASPVVMQEENYERAFKAWTPVTPTPFVACGEDTPDAIVHKEPESLEGIVGGSAVSVTERLGGEKPRQPCETRIFSKFPHEVASIYEVMRRYKEVEIASSATSYRYVRYFSYTYKNATTGADVKIKYMAMMPHLQYPWKCFFRMHAGSVKFRLFCKQGSVQSISFYPEGDLDWHVQASLHRMMPRQGVRHDLACPTTGTADTTGYYPNLRFHNPGGESWGYPAMEMMYNQSESNWIDFTVPFYSQFDRIATCWRKTQAAGDEDYSWGEGKGLVIVQFKDDSWNVEDMRLFMKAADDYRVSVFGAPSATRFGLHLGGGNQSGMLSGFKDAQPTPVPTPVPTPPVTPYDSEEEGDDDEY